MTLYGESNLWRTNHVSMVKLAQLYRNLASCVDPQTQPEGEKLSHATQIDGITQIRIQSQKHPERLTELLRVKCFVERLYFEST
jgi:hypothetical protein